MLSVVGNGGECLKFSVKNTVLLYVLLAALLMLANNLTPNPVVATGITRVQGPYRGTSTTGVVAGGAGNFTVTMTSTPTQGDTEILTFAGAAKATQGVCGFQVLVISQTGVTWQSSRGGPFMGDAYANDGLGTCNGSGTQGAGPVATVTSIWAGIVGAGAGKTVTVTWSINYYPGVLQAISVVADICEYSGLSTTIQVDQTASMDNIGSTTLTTGLTGTTSQANELFVGSIAVNGYAQSQKTYTMLDGAQVGNGVSDAYLENIATSTGTAEGQTTVPTATNGCGAIATFESA